MKFYCTCGHSRGNHADSTKPKREVGGCVSCKCNKYNSDKQQNKNANKLLEKKFLRILGIPTLILILVFVINGTINHVQVQSLVFGVAFLFVFVYYTMLAPLDRLQKRVFSR